jgi:putative chitinase
MKYFTISELCQSSTAKARGIDNTPSEEHKKHLEELIENILDPLRAAWGSAIRVNSGYRSPKLNKAVGGSTTSAHCHGYAADLYPVNGKISEFKQFVKKWLKDKKFDQYINEYKGKSEWVHIGLKNSTGKQRKQYLIFRGGKYSYISGS